MFFDLTNFLASNTMHQIYNILENKKMANQFREPNHVDIMIDNGKKPSKLIGVVRIKPNRILWRNANESLYHKVNLEDFITWMETKETGKM